MSRPRNTGSFFWGFILIVVGTIFLLKNLGYEIPIWAGVARYWPVLLIVWGLIKLVDYGRWKKAGQPGPLFGAGEVVLLIIVILSGTALTAASNVGSDFDSFFEFAGVNILDITGKEYQFTEHHEQVVPSGSSIEIINRYGSVEVTPADTDQIVLEVAKSITASEEKLAEELSKDFNYSIVEEANRYRVISNYNRDDNRLRGRRFRTSLTVKVPKRSNVTINNRYGGVEISDITGDQHVENGFGPAVVSRIAGAVDIKNRNDRVVVEDVTGAAVIVNEFADVEVRRIGGRLELKDRNGNVEVEEVKGDADISNQFGSINLKDIQGALTVNARNTSVEALRVGGNVAVENQFHYVTLEDVKGTVSVVNRNGNVELRYTEPPRNNIRVTNKFSDVRMILPSSSSFSIDARTRFASVSTDFDELSARDEPDRNSLTGKVGSGGPEIRIENMNGSIHISK
ncbi:MAG TPA: DUF4097 family beta strand repeat-containing protein [Terriglobia bacterium]|nr:DUF4097 family beta strand repeat-containing protein [Terriglobia bacterium]